VPSSRRCSTFVGVLFLFLLAGTATASAHVIDSTGYSTVQQNGQEVSYVLSLEYDILIKAVDLGPQAASAVDDSQREEALEAGTDKLKQYLDDRVIVSLDGAACEPALQGSSIGKRGQKPYAELDLRFTCPGASGSYRLQYKVFAESEAVADDHTNVVQYRFGDKSGRTIFDRSHHDVAIGHSTVAGSSAQFAQLGVKHILLGLDHVLFVVALILGAATFHGLLKVISMFTVAHSVTLIATLLGGIDVPAVIVEPLIALSIAFVAVENSHEERCPVTPTS